jgi:hypothetical protein
MSVLKKIMFRNLFICLIFMAISFEVHAQSYTVQQFLSLPDLEQERILRSRNFKFTDLVKTDWSKRLVENPVLMREDENSFYQYNYERQLHILRSGDMYVICPGGGLPEKKRITRAEWNNLPDTKKELYMKQSDKFEIVD